MFDLKMFSGFGIYMSAAALGLVSIEITAQEVKLGNFMRAATAEPIVFGEKDCQSTGLAVCSGSAVAAVALEFPDQGSIMVRKLASNLVASAPFLRTKIDNKRADDTATSFRQASKVPTLLEDVVQTASNSSGELDLTIPVNFTGASNQETPSLTANLRDTTPTPKFSFQKSYAFLK